MLKSIINSFLLGLFLFLVMNGQSANNSGRENKPVDLTFENSITEQKYCLNGQIYLRFKTDFTNSGNIPLLLDRGSDFFYKWKIKQIEGKMKKNYETIIAPMFNDGEIFKFDQNPDENFFVTLQPNELYSFYTKGGILITLYNKSHKNGLKPGKYTVQFWAATWYYSLVSANDYRLKWKEKGYLWSNDIISQPTVFEIKENQPPTECKIS